VTTGRKIKAGAAVLVVGAMALSGLTLATTQALASVTGAVATLANPSSLQPLESGSSTTSFTVTLPANAACAGDTASGGYHVYSYLIPRHTDPSSVTFVNFPSAGYGLVDNTGTYYGRANTAITTGQVVGIPNDFQWGPLVTTDGGSVTLSQLLYSGSSGVWEGGLACANSGGAVTNYWNTEVTFTASSGDPNGFTWAATPGGPQLVQVAPTTGRTTPVPSSSFSSQLAVAESSGPVTYTVTVPSASLAVSSSGAVTTTGPLDVGSYTTSGTDSDTGGDAGTWSFTLTVSAGTLTQQAPLSGSTSPSASSGYSAQLAASGAVGAVAYAVTSHSIGLAVSSSGAVTTTGTLAGATYTAHGTDSDSSGDLGTWTFTLTVSPTPFTFTSANTTSATVGKHFSFVVRTAGSPVPKLKQKGKRPKGVTFVSNGNGTGTLSGTPTSTAKKSAAGTYVLTFTATFGKGKTKHVATQTFTLHVTP
jgi:hypothetical protein